MSCLPPVADLRPVEWLCHDSSPLNAPLPGPIPCQGETDAIANDNAQRCRRSGVAIDPMFLN